MQEKSADGHRNSGDDDLVFDSSGRQGSVKKALDLCWQTPACPTAACQSTFKLAWIGSAWIGRSWSVCFDGVPAVIIVWGD